MQKAGDVQSSLARELAEYEMQVEKDVLAPMASLLEVILYNYLNYLLLVNNFQIETHNFKFTKHVSDDQHPSSVANTSEPLVGVV